MPTNRAASLQLVDPVLTQVARRYQSRGFIADRILPSIPVNTLTGKYPVFDKQFWFGNDVDNKKSDRAPTKELDFRFDTETYACEEYGFKVSITDLERQQADKALRLEQSKVDFLMLRQRLAREVRVANLLRKTTNGGGLAHGDAPSQNWNTDSATIEADIMTAVTTIYDATGMTPNTLILPYKVAYAVSQQQDIRDILKYTVNGQDIIRLGDGILPRVLHGLQVIVPMGPQVTTAQEGAASPSYSEVWGDHARVLYVDPSAGWGTPSVAYDFLHTPETIKRWRSDDPDIDYIRVLERRDEKVVAPDLGYELSGLLA